MDRKVGLWLDQRTAYIIWDGTEQIHTIESNIRARPHYAGGIRIGGTYNQGRDSELRHNDRYAHQLHEYFEKIISAVRDADLIYIFGPGEARFELEKLIRKDKTLRECLQKVEPCDRLTQAQMRERVRKFYQEQVRN